MDGRPTVVGVLLAGGAGRRAGVDKRFLVLEGQTLPRRNLAFLHDLFQTVCVSVAEGKEFDLGDDEGVEVVVDAWPGSSPLAGIATALQRYGRPVFALAADCVAPDREAAERVLAAFPAHDLALPSIDRHYQPLFAVYGPSCLTPAMEMLEAGRHRIIDLLERVDACAVPFPDESRFRGVNTMTEFEEVRDAMEHHDTGGVDRPPALVAIVGKTDSGKTTFIEKLVPELIRLGMVVGTVKHDAHSFEIDHPGKDSWRHGQSGARAYTIASAERLAFIARLDGEMPLTDIVRRFYAGFDVVVAEGYKRTAPHCIEIFRTAAGYDEPICAPGEAIALVTDAALDHGHRFALDDPEGVGSFIAARLDSLRRY